MTRFSLPVILTVFIVLQSSFAHSDAFRYSGEVYGGVTVTGNAIGLSKQLDANGPGTEDSIGTFMALNPSDVDDSPANVGNPWFAGTTGDWLANGSSAELVLPAGAQVLYAELIWAGSYNYTPDDVTAYLDTTVNFYYEGTNATPVSPDPATAVTISEVSYSGFLANYYQRSAVVTSYVAAHGAGTYTVGKIPATQGATQNSLNAGGWALIVVYDDPAEAFPSHVTVGISGQWIDEDYTASYTDAGFTAATAGTVEGRILFVALEGDADITGDTASLAAPGGTVALSGANNPADNFFASQINTIDGLLDTTGTFGTQNHDALTAADAIGARQGWDITGIPISSDDAEVAWGQTNLSVEVATTGDSFMLAFLAFQVDSNGAERDISTGGGGGGGCNTAGSSGPVWPDLLLLAMLGGGLLVWRKRMTYSCPSLGDGPQKSNIDIEL